jgi:hypothetical protein
LIVAFKANNVCSLQEHSLPALKDFADCFLRIGFEQSALADIVYKAYLHTSKDDGLDHSVEGEAVRKAVHLEGQEESLVGSVCESILSYSISFTYCLLENPGIWGDIPYGEEIETD